MLRQTKKTRSAIQFNLLLCASVLITSCSGQENTAAGHENTAAAHEHADTLLTPTHVRATVTEEGQPSPFIDPTPAPDAISQYVRCIFEDKNGHLWFGTNGKGVARYNGDVVEYFSLDQGFGGVAVRGILEDAAGNVWFGTERGITKYDPTSVVGTGTESSQPKFINYTAEHGLIQSNVWSLAIDSRGTIWIGTLEELYRFDPSISPDSGEDLFTPFYIPASYIDATRGVSSTKIVQAIMEDSKGQMWFGTNSGAYLFDPSVSDEDGEIILTNISEKDGLCNNAVNDILEDKQGNIWFATHHKGVSRYNVTDKSFTNFTADKLIAGDEVWSLFEDSDGNIWFPAEGFGVYRYDAAISLETGETHFTNFDVEHGMESRAIQCSFEDKAGTLWFGGWLGLFRYDSDAEFGSYDSFVRVGLNGPWRK
jgi:ligand-binding sensor domain-containing protein